MTLISKPKSRLRRLLGFKSTLVVQVDKNGGGGGEDHSTTSPETDISDTSSDILSYSAASSNGDNNRHYHTNDDDAIPEVLHEQTGENEDGLHDDEYADVRERLEELSARDRARYASSAVMDQVDGRFSTNDSAAVSGSSKKASSSASRKQSDHHFLPVFAAYTTYLGYAVLILCGHIRDLFAKLCGQGRYVRSTGDSPFASDDLLLYAPLLKSWENFYTRRLYHRIQDCFNRPIASNPGATIQVLERVSDDGNKTMHLLGSLEDLDDPREYQNGAHMVRVPPLSPSEHHHKHHQRVARQCLNLGSYNYLGFADDWQVTCSKDVLESIQSFPVSNSSCRNEYGTTTLHRQVEETVARFLGKEDALALNMGYNTNSTTIPALTGRGDLLISDELNHTSIVSGARASGAAIRIFRHNNTDHLEEILREAIVMGRPRTRRPWNKILVIVEGIYSMEGEYCDLANVVRVCKKYGAFVYLDEAHSVGAMGPTGRGCAEYCGVDTADIDIMMGTFTKSFGGMGGYIAASKDVISYLRKQCAGSAHHNSLSPAVCQQVISSFKVSLQCDICKASFCNC